MIGLLDIWTAYYVDGYILTMRYESTYLQLLLSLRYGCDEFHADVLEYPTAWQPRPGRLGKPCWAMSYLHV
jgi:hypothetical protein